MGNKQSHKSHKNRRKFSHHYINGKRIGTGTFAIVKRCTRISDKKEFAVKIIDKGHLTGREILGLKDEIHILKSISFPHVIQMIDVFDDGRRVQIVLELAEGGDLFDRILQAPKKHLEEHQVAYITYIIAKSLKYLHNNYVIHRDLKPENILFTSDNVLKVTDFGVAHYLKFPPSEHIMHTCCGTPHYVAPEVLQHSEYTNEVDLWSLGVIVYLMLSGLQPFNHHSIHAMYDLIKKGQYKFTSPYWDNISDGAKDLVEKLLCVNSKKRYNVNDIMKHKWILKYVDINKLQKDEQMLRNKQKELNILYKDPNKQMEQGVEEEKNGF